MDRLKLRKKLFPNAPKNVSCKICNVKFPNPILNGSSIASVVCEICRAEMCRSKKNTKKKKRRVAKPTTGSSSSTTSHVSPPKTVSPVNAGLLATSLLPNSIQGWVE